MDIILCRSRYMFSFLFSFAVLLLNKIQLRYAEKHLLVSNVNMLAMFVLRLTSNSQYLLNSGEHHIFCCVFCCPQGRGHDPATTN